MEKIFEQKKTKENQAKVISYRKIYEKNIKFYVFFRLNIVVVVVAPYIFGKKSKGKRLNDMYVG
jgi:hypothetical protein